MTFFECGLLYDYHRFQGNVGNDQIDWNVHHSLPTLSLSQISVSRPVCVEGNVLETSSISCSVCMIVCVRHTTCLFVNKKIHTLIKICVLRKFWFRASAQISLCLCGGASCNGMTNAVHNMKYVKVIDSSSKIHDQIKLCFNNKNLLWWCR